MSLYVVHDDLITWYNFQREEGRLMWNKAKLISVEITEPTKKAKFKVCIITLFAPVQTIVRIKRQF